MDTIYIKNKRVQCCCITVIKVDAQDECIRLPCAVFELYRVYDRCCESLYKDCFVTDKCGRIVIDNLPYGMYRLKETRPPCGYENCCFCSPVINLTAKQQSVEIVVFNQKSQCEGIKSRW